MNRGDTSFLMLDYTLNGNPLVQGDYEEIEVTINMQGMYRCVKKTLTSGDIEWGTMTYLDEQGHAQTFVGYYAHLSQEDTFLLSSGANDIQVRILEDGEVGSSDITKFSVGNALSSEVLNANI